MIFVDNPFSTKIQIAMGKDLRRGDYKVLITHLTEYQATNLAYFLEHQLFDEGCDNQ